MQFSVITKSNLDKIVLRIDAEFYHPDFIQLEKKLDSIKTTTVRAVKGKLDCSAFYPSIVEYYNFEKVGIPFLRVDEIQNGLINLTSNTVFLPRNILDKNKNTIAHCSEGDIVIAKGGNTIAKVALLTNEFKEYSVCRDLIVLRTEKLTDLNRFFLWIFLHSKYGKKSLLRTASQTGQPHLTIEALYELRIPKLSTKFQEKFEELYSTIMERQAASLKAYGKAEQTLLSELGLLDWKPKHQLSFVKNFSDSKGVARIDAEYFQPMYDELIEKVKQYKNGYKTLDDLVFPKKCIEPGSEAYQEAGIPFLRVSNLSKFGINSDNQQYISESLYEELSNYQPQRGEILLSKDASPGIAYYLNNEPPKMIPSGGILRLKVKAGSNICPEYLNLVLNSIVVQKQIERDIGGSVINHWLVDQVKKALIPIIPDALQKEISNIITDSFMKREQSKKLLDIAKRGVELAIEQGEKEAQGWIEKEVASIIT